MPRLPHNRRRFLSSLVVLPACAWRSEALALPRLMLAQPAPAVIDPADYLVSEKFDGVRAHWDGRVLRFRSGLPIVAPESFVRRLPELPLDGELWLGRGQFEALSGLVRRRSPDAAAWRELRYLVFDLPGASGPFVERARRIAALAAQQGWPQLLTVEQTRLDSPRALQRRLNDVVAAGGECLMLHRADAGYEGGRSAALLKLKPLHDAEARVTGHVAGRGRHEGRLGALRVRIEQGVDLSARHRIQRRATARPAARRQLGPLHPPRLHRRRRAAIRQLPAPALRALLRRSPPAASARRAPASRVRHGASP
jgi:DNA ligase-1